DTGELIGMIDVVGYIDGCPNIGYVSGKKYWNKGYMSEALKALVDMLENKGFKKILIRADERNIGSNRVILKNGFKLIRKERQPLSEYKPEMTTVNYYIKDNTGIC
ncbi:MAG: GNAT family protein, partial [Erysipelotrichaceae bacterium]|nr:GNAT family protein [Erysipelotrichaceae bacterium]